MGAVLALQEAEFFLQAIHPLAVPTEALTFNNGYQSLPLENLLIVPGQIIPARLKGRFWRDIYLSALQIVIVPAIVKILMHLSAELERVI